MEKFVKMKGCAYVKCNVQRRTQQGRIVYLSQTGMIFPEDRVKDWEDLTADEKRRSIKASFEAKLETIEFSTAKDPTLKVCAEKWIKDAEQHYKKCLSELTPF